MARLRHPTDGRARSVILTAKGRRMYDRLRLESEPLRERLLAVFRPEELTVLLGSLSRVAEVMVQPENSRGRTRHKPATAVSNGGRTMGDR